MGVDEYVRLKVALVTRLLNDLEGPKDNSMWGWDLACKAALFFMFGEGLFAFECENKSELAKKLCQQLARISARFGQSRFPALWICLYQLMQEVGRHDRKGMSSARRNADGSRQAEGDSRSSSHAAA